ncbi:Nif3-like dinuclear metal center hexameric protein [Eubacteriales bacterium OttesenSCG-928-N13]|nr:Nif3-like dinuclear metal center hexameric protein [Eubacteriales bacterium OttesenSCG-928-N13]
MAVTVQQIAQLIDQMAPFDTAVSYDNVGLLVGHPDSQVDKILVALDLTMGAIEEAQQMRAQLIVTHHPVMFHARKNLREDEAEGALLCALVRSGIAMIAAHTNFDAARGGVSEVLAETVGITNLEPIADGLVTIGDYDGTLDKLMQDVRALINPNARLYGKDKPLKRVAACGGAGSDFWIHAQQAGADAYLLGEVRHYDALAAVQSGMPLIDAGHYETERLSLKALVHGLQTRANELQYNVRVQESEYEPFL